MIFHKSIATLQKIENLISNKIRGAYLRFGDGDVNLANGLSIWDCNDNDMYNHKNIKMITEIRECFRLEGPGILKTLPLYCNKYDGLEEGMYPGNHECSDEWADELLDSINYWWNPIEVYSHCALHFLSSHKPEIAQQFLRSIKGKVDIFIGGLNIDSKIVHYVLGDQCEIISVPDKYCSLELDNIESKIKIKDDYQLVVTCMGCAGRVLQKRLYTKKYNMFTFDFGSLMDALCGINSRAWINLTGFDKDKFLGGL